MSGNVQVDQLLGLINQAAKDAVAEYQSRGKDVLPLDTPDVHPLDSETNLVALKKAIRLLEGATAHLCNMLAPPIHTIVTCNSRQDTALYRVAVEASLADILEAHPEGLSIDKLAEAADLPAPKLGQVMQTLVANSCFREVDSGVYANNRISYALRSTSETDAAGLVSVTTREGRLSQWKYWEYLKDPETRDATGIDNTCMLYALRKEGMVLKTPFDYFITQVFESPCC